MQSDIRLGRASQNWTPGSYRIESKGFWTKTVRSFGGYAHQSPKGPDQSIVTTLTGDLRDQSQLLGVLNSLYELHLPILLVEFLEKNNGV